MLFFPIQFISYVSSYIISIPSFICHIHRDAGNNNFTSKIETFYTQKMEAFPSLQFFALLNKKKFSFPVSSSSSSEDAKNEEFYIFWTIFMDGRGGDAQHSHPLHLLLLLHHHLLLLSIFIFQRLPLVHVHDDWKREGIALNSSRTERNVLSLPPSLLSVSARLSISLASSRHSRLTVNEERKKSNVE